jgi:bacterioferritin (cytochrome b1)
MMAKPVKTRAAVDREIELLTQALQLEYTMSVQYPKFAELIHDGEIQRLVRGLGIASIKHADVVLRAIVELGGTPEWSFEFVESSIDVRHIFKKQLEKEKLALELHTQTADLMEDISLKEEFSQLAQEEKQHIETVERILAGLD